MKKKVFFSANTVAPKKKNLTINTYQVYGIVYEVPSMLRAWYVLFGINSIQAIQYFLCGTISQSITKTRQSMVSKVPYTRCSTICWLLLRRRIQTWTNDNTISLMQSPIWITLLTPSRRVSPLKSERVTFTYASRMKSNQVTNSSKLCSPVKISTRCTHYTNMIMLLNDRPTKQTHVQYFLLPLKSRAPFNPFAISSTSLITNITYLCAYCGRRKVPYVSIRLVTRKR